MIAIKEMEMSKKCVECPMYHQSGINVYCGADYVGIDNVYKKRDNCPLVEIVTCKDCKHRDPEDKFCDCGHRIKWSSPREDDFYCADAERRE